MRVSAAWTLSTLNACVGVMNGMFATRAPFKSSADQYAMEP